MTETDIDQSIKGTLRVFDPAGLAGSADEQSLRQNRAAGEPEPWTTDKNKQAVLARHTQESIVLLKNAGICCRWTNRK
jgi:hypothetical protein